MAAVMDVDHLKKDLERVLERLRNDYVKNLSLRSAGQGLSFGFHRLGMKICQVEGRNYPKQD